MFDTGGRDGDRGGGLRLADRPAEHPAVLALTAAVDALIAASRSGLSGLSRDELLGVLRGVETQKRRLAVADHHLVTELVERGTAADLGVGSPRSLLTNLLRISPGEAAGRVTAADRFGPRTALSGAPLPPQFPVVAAAVGEGAVSDRHAQLIGSTIEKLPAAVRATHGDSVEVFLTEQARLGRVS